MLPSLISFISAIVSVAMAVAVLWRDLRIFAHQVFAIGMGLFAADAIIVGLAPWFPSLEEVLHLQQTKLFIASLLPAVWLLFSLTFARTNYREFISRWKWALIGCLAFGPLVFIFFRNDLFVGLPLYDQSLRLFLKLNWAGYLLLLFGLIANVLILMNLERTLRNSTGHVRWQIKFLIIGLGGLFGVHIYTSSQSILYRVLDTNLQVVNSAALLIAALLIARSLMRTRLLRFDFYLSHSFLYNSFTVLVVGVYFVVVGVAARLAYHFKKLADPSMVAFLVLLSVLGIAVVMLSDKLRFKRKRFISRHFKRPIYDYQQVWAGFTENTASIGNTKDLCLAIVTLVSHTLDVLAVSIWLADEQKDDLVFGSSTMLSEAKAKENTISSEMGRELLQLMLVRAAPVDLYEENDEPFEQFRLKYQEDLKRREIFYSIPIRAGGRLVGIMTLGEKVLYQKLSFEDYELLRTIADQAGASLLNLKLVENLKRTKELEAFQVMSAFFMHDLKNLASKLSLVNQNMPVHFRNEEFREDAARTMSQCVDKIKGMCSRLSLLSQTLNLELSQVDLNSLIEQTIDGMNGQLSARLVRNFGDLPRLMLDDEQMQKVILNLLINAGEATGSEGKISLTTSHLLREGWAEFCVSDNGCGMSREFMEKYLFKPFQTTKRQGMGIGLFHCKTIVEAHGGRIEVESEQDVGTTVRVLLPVSRGRE